MPSAQQQTVTIHFRGQSDGSTSRWPTEAAFIQEGSNVYLSKLATKYAKEKGMYVAGTQYVLDRLPPGYMVFTKHREQNPEHLDRYLCGHPKYKFRSPEEFYRHFEILMDNGSPHGCTCKGCARGKTNGPVTISRSETPVSRPSSVVSHQGGSVKLSALRAAQAAAKDTAPKLSQQHQRNHNASTTATSSSALPMPAPNSRSTKVEWHDSFEDSRDDIYTQLINRLRKESQLSIPIEEKDSFDWRVEDPLLPALFQPISSQPRFVPRLGELVLFVRSVPPGHSIMTHPDTGNSCFESSEHQILPDKVSWEAGVISQVPERIHQLHDLTVPGSMSLPPARFRIEPMPRVGVEEKVWSKRVAHVSLPAIRPFSFHREVLKGSKIDDWHVTVLHSLIVMSSFSLLKRFHFKGEWPSATIFNKGIYIGSELLVVGDVVRLMPRNGEDKVTDVMKITSIKMKIGNLDPDQRSDLDDDEDDVHSFSTCIHVAGIALTLNKDKNWRPEMGPVSSQALPRGLAQYGTWYARHDPTKRWEAPFSDIIGRCYEAESLEVWFGDNAAPDQRRTSTGSSSHAKRAVTLSKGLKAVVQAREYSAREDLRIAEGRKWFWADTRMEQLDLDEFCGARVARAFDRDPEAWSRALRTRQRAANKATPDAETGAPTSTPKHSSAMVAASAVGAGDASQQDVDMPDVDAAALEDSSSEFDGSDEELSDR